MRKIILLAVAILATGFVMAQAPQLGNIGDSAREIEQLPGSTGIQVDNDGNMFVETAAVMGKYEYNIVYFFENGSCMLIAVYSGHKEMYTLAEQFAKAFSQMGSEDLPGGAVYCGGAVYSLRDREDLVILYIASLDYYKKTLQKARESIEKKG